MKVLKIAKNMYHNPLYKCDHKVLLTNLTVSCTSKYKTFHDIGRNVFCKPGDS